VPTVEASPGRRSGRLPWLIIVVVALTVLAMYAAVRLSAASDGTQMLLDISSPNVHGIRLRVHDASSGLRSDDVLLAIDGRSIDDLLADIYTGRTGLPPSDGTREYTVVRAGQPTAIHVADDAGSTLLPSLVADWPLYLMLLYLAAVGLFTFARRPDREAARVLGALGVVVLAAQLIQYVGFSAVDLLRGPAASTLLVIRVVLSMLTLGLAAHFALVFPRRFAGLDERRWLLPAIYAGPVVSYVILLALQWPSDPSPLLVFVAHLRALFLNSAVWLGAATVVFFGRAWRSRAALERRQTLWVAWGMAVAMIPWIAIVSAAVVMGASVRDVLAPASLTWAAIPTAFSIAIIRAGLFDIEVLVRRTLVYGLLTAILAGLYAASVALSQRVLVAMTGSGSDIAVVVATLVVVIAFSPIKDAIQRQVDLRYKGESPAVARVRAFGTQVEQRVGAVEPEQVGRRFLGTVVDAFGLSGGELWLGQRRSPSARVGDPPTDGTTRVPITTGEGIAVGCLELGAHADGSFLRADESAVTAEVARTIADAVVADRTSGRSSTREPSGQEAG
jgi:hypothetical protein